MFNAEKYIGDCLDSVLAQTFDNYEVIVVNNCSTDNSVAIVESYIPKFGGRLKLYHMEANTGSGAMPRNKGISFARGEYFFFMDADDAIIKIALEEMYAFAKDYGADVVYNDINYRAKDDLSGIHTEIGQSGTPVYKPTLETENLAERVQEILRGRYIAPQWRKFVRRQLILDNEIFFPDTRPSDDDIWTDGLVFYAKRFLRVPEAIYIRRLTEDSIMRIKKTPQQTVNFWLNPAIRGVRALDKLMSKLEFFQANPRYRYSILEMFVNGKLGAILQESFKLPSFTVYETIKQEFGDRLGEQDVLVSTLCTIANTQQKVFLMNQQKFKEFAAQSQKRIAELEAQLKTK